jgi:F-type H+-transporting ATPase subunit a
MTKGAPGTDLLRRSLTASWIVAFALAALLLYAPRRAASVVPGSSSARSTVFLRKIVKLFTGGTAGRTDRGRVARRDAAILGWATLKLLIVYGGAFALVRLTPWTRLIPLRARALASLATLFLKSIMLAFGTGPASLTRRATQTVASLGNAASRPLIFLLGSLLAPALARAAEHAATPATKHAEGAQELPNWIVILHDFFPGNPLVQWLEQNQFLVFAWLGGLVFFAIVWLAMRNAKPVPGHLQNAIEWIVESMQDVCGGMLGKDLNRYFPFIGAIFFYILTINMLGIIPGMKSSTSTLDLTLALALIVFVYVQYSGIRNLGPLGYLDHLAGSPRDAIGFAMLPVMIPVHILGELVKPVSLSCRLFGNIFGEDTLIVVFVGVAALCLKAGLTLLAVPPSGHHRALHAAPDAHEHRAGADLLAAHDRLPVHDAAPRRARERGDGARSPSVIHGQEVDGMTSRPLWDSHFRSDWPRGHRVGDRPRIHGPRRVEAMGRQPEALPKIGRDDHRFGFIEALTIYAFVTMFFLQGKISNRPRAAPAGRSAGRPPGPGKALWNGSSI